MMKENEITKKVEEIITQYAIKKHLLPINIKEIAKSLTSLIEQEVLKGRIDELERISTYTKATITTKQDIRNRILELKEK